MSKILWNLFSFVKKIYAWMFDLASTSEPTPDPIPELTKHAPKSNRAAAYDSGTVSVGKIFYLQSLVSAFQRYNLRKVVDLEKSCC